MESTWVITAQETALQKFPGSSITSVVVSQPYKAVIALKLPGLSQEAIWRNHRPDDIWIAPDDVKNYRKYKKECNGNGNAE